MRASIASILFLWFLMVAVIESANAQATESLEALLRTLSERQGFFNDGILEVRQSDWSLDAHQGIESVLAVTDLFVRTPVGADRALANALKIESEAIALLGAPVQTAWAFYHCPAGSKLIEVPLEPGEKANDGPRPSRLKGLKMHGFQQGTIARYNQMAGALHLSKGSVDDAFAFRTRYVDPTIDRMELLQVLKQGARGVTISASGHTVLVRVKSSPPEEFRFDALADARYVLAHLRVGVTGSLPKEECFFGNYARFSGSPLAVPTSAMRTERNEGRLAASLFTVRKWERRPIERQEIEIRIPQGTKIVRDDLTAEQRVAHDVETETPAPRVETRP